MKKYSLFSFFFLLSVILLGFSGIKFASATNCAPGEMFSTTTGQACGNTTSVVTCPTGDLFSSLTGQRCTAWKNSSNQQFQMGMRGESVRVFQQILKDDGFLSGKVDGIYGPMTDGATVMYYKRYPPIAPPPTIPPGPASVIPPELCPLTTSINGVTGHTCPPRPEPVPVSPPLPSPFPPSTTIPPPAFLPLVSISSLSPTSGPDGTVITIKGGNFTLIGNSVTFKNQNNISNQVTVSDLPSSDGTTIQVKVPTESGPNCIGTTICPMYMTTLGLSPGVYDLTVANSNGTSNAMTFTVAITCPTNATCTTPLVQ